MIALLLWSGATQDNTYLHDAYTPPRFRRYPADTSAVTQETLAVMRATAIDREKNREAARVAVLNVRFGVDALATHLDGGLMLPMAAAAPTVAQTMVRERWRKAITKVRRWLHFDCA